MRSLSFLYAHFPPPTTNKLWDTNWNWKNVWSLHRLHSCSSDGEEDESFWTIEICWPGSTNFTAWKINELLRNGKLNAGPPWSSVCPFFFFLFPLIHPHSADNACKYRGVIDAGLKHSLVTHYSLCAKLQRLDSWILSVISCLEKRQWNSKSTKVGVETKS